MRSQNNKYLTTDFILFSYALSSKAMKDRASGGWVRASRVLFSRRSVRCHKLPRALKDWPEYKDLCQKIDDFNALVPMLEQMTHEAMLLRHWKAIQSLTGLTFDDEAQQFTLGTVLQPSLLSDKHRVEVLQLFVCSINSPVIG